MGPTWVLSVPDGPHVGPMNLAIRDNDVIIAWYVHWVADYWPAYLPSVACASHASHLGTACCPFCPWWTPVNIGPVSGNPVYRQIPPGVPLGHHPRHWEALYGHTWCPRYSLHRSGPCLKNTEPILTLAPLPICCTYGFYPEFLNKSDYHGH